MANPLEVKAELGGRERRFCLSALGLYKAVKKYGYASEEIDLDDLTEREADKLTLGGVMANQVEEVWMSVLHYEDISLEDFLAELRSDDLAQIQLIWRDVKLIQGDIEEDTSETEDEEPPAEPAKGKKKAS